MDFAWEPEQQSWFDRTRDFCRERLSAAAFRGDASFDHERWRACATAGLASLCVSSASGGQGLGALTTVAAMEAFGRDCRDRGWWFALAAHQFAVCLPIDEFGTAQQKATWLPGLSSGEWIAGNGLTEREAGTDVFAMQTTARPVAGGYLLNGEKSYVTNAPWADWLLIYAVTQPEFRSLGITAFVVARNAPGVSLGPPIAKSGLTTAQACAVRFEDCFVPAAQRLGAEGQGAAIFLRAMTWERVGLFAAYLGVLDRQLEQCTAFARQRRQFQRPIGDFQAVSHRVVNMKLRLEAGRLLTYRAAWAIDRGESAALESALCKLAVSEAAVESALDAIQLHGACGLSPDTGVEADLRDALPSRIFSGTSEILRNLVAAEMGL